MPITRRALLASAAVSLFAKSAGWKLGVTDWNLEQSGKIEALELASRLGFDGVEVSLGHKPDGSGLALDGAEIEARYLEAAKKHRVAIAGTCLNILHRNYLKSDPLGAKWVAAGIPVTRRLHARVMLLPFFSKAALETQAEMERTADLLRELGPEAEKAGIVLGLENTISAEDNARILDRARSRAVRVYYDVGNSTHMGGFNVLKEIRWLGKDRICQIHLKDTGYLGEGKIDFPQVIQAIGEIGFNGFCNLETSSPSGSVEADMKRNLDYIRKLARG